MDSERILANQTVLVEGDRIIAMGPSDEIPVPEGAYVIDGTGQYLIPGLAEMHGHIPPPTQARDEIDDVLFLYAANGITTVRGMLGWPGQLALRDSVNSGTGFAPTLYLAGPSFSGQTVSSPEQARARVRRQVREGWNLLKVHPGMSRAAYDAMAEEAHAHGIRFGGHVPAAVGLEHALAKGQETFDHIDGYVAYLGGSVPLDPWHVADIVAATLDAGAWIVPTGILWETLLGVAPLETLTSYPELIYVSAQTRASWERAHRARRASVQPNAQQTAMNRLDILKALSDGGVPILMGTDAPQQFSVPGFSLHREMNWMTDAGMTPFQVLTSGTAAVGRYFENEDVFGLVAVGHRADLLLLNTNPLDDLANVADRSGVMVRGRWMPEDIIQRGLADIAGRYAER